MVMEWYEIHKEELLQDWELIRTTGDFNKIQPLREINYFKSFKISLNTITWDNEADFAPEFLLELGKLQELKKSEYA